MENVYWSILHLYDQVILCSSGIFLILAPWHKTVKEQPNEISNRFILYGDVVSYNEPNSEKLHNKQIKKKWFT